MTQEQLIAVATVIYTIITIINNIKGKKSILAAKEEVTQTFTNNEKSLKQEIDDLKTFKVFILASYKQDLLERLEITNDEIEKQLILDKLDTLKKMSG